MPLHYLQLEADWTYPDYLVAEVMSRICGIIEIIAEDEGDSCRATLRPVQALTV